VTYFRTFKLTNKTGSHHTLCVPYYITLSYFMKKEANYKLKSCALRDSEEHISSWIKHLLQDIKSMIFGQTNLYKCDQIPGCLFLFLMSL
jgi:hypothetical protein